MNKRRIIDFRELDQLVVMAAKVEGKSMARFVRDAVRPIVLETLEIKEVHDAKDTDK
mgnify:CR=1 FL=1